MQQKLLMLRHPSQHPLLTFYPLSQKQIPLIKFLRGEQSLDRHTLHQSSDRGDRPVTLTY